MTSTKPNIVFFFWDNLGWGEVGCYDGGILRGAPTPRIDRETIGTFTLFIDGKVTATLENAKIQNGKFSLCGEGLNIGRDGGAPVTSDYPGSRPWPFTGGTIQQVIFDVSGEPYLDLEKEALAMMKRD